MPAWSDLFLGFLRRELGEAPDGAAVSERYRWVSDLHARAREALRPETLRALPEHGIYACLESLSIPGCAVRMTNLGRTNDARRVAESILVLMETPGGFEAKFRAAKVPQAGVVTLTQILCAAKPMRFFVRNAAFTRAAATVIPLYPRKALEELAYDDFLDLVAELARLLEAHLAPAGLAAWAREHRYLLLYAVLTGKS